MNCFASYISDERQRHAARITNASYPVLVIFYYRKGRKLQPSTSPFMSSSFSCGVDLRPEMDGVPDLPRKTGCAIIGSVFNKTHAPTGSLSKN